MGIERNACHPISQRLTTTPMARSTTIKRVLVTGASGQLGRSLQDLTHEYPKLEFVFMDSKDLDITDSQKVKETIELGAFEHCINCAAYTNVEQAEKARKRPLK